MTDRGPLPASARIFVPEIIEGGTRDVSVDGTRGQHTGETKDKSPAVKAMIMESLRLIHSPPRPILRYFITQLKKKENIWPLFPVVTHGC
jgi:hypothetical protein